MISKKVMLLGEIGVGKSSLARRLVLNKFEFDYKPTLGVDIYRYEVPKGSDREEMALIIWDTDGNIGQSIFKHIYMKQAAAALILGDVTRRDTLNTMLALGNGFRESFPGRQFCYVANKIDLLEEPSQAVLPDEFVKQKAPVITTSAKTGHNVENAFLDLASAIHRRGL